MMLKIPKPTISLSETLERFNKLKPKKINLEDLQSEVSQVKKEIQQLKKENTNLKDRVFVLELDKKFKLINNNSDSSSKDDKPESSNQRLIKSDDEIRYCNLIKKITPVKWHTNVKIIIENYEIESSSSDEYSSSSSSSPDIKLSCNDNCCKAINVITKSLNVLTKQEEQEELLLEAISKINDPELKASMLYKLKKMLSKKETNDVKNT